MLFLDSNPFEMQKASHYSDDEVLNFWVDLTERQGGLVSLLEPKSLMPTFILGGKGSGKTHLMRFCSSPVQQARHGTLAQAIKREGYLGTYVLADALNTHRFDGKGIDAAAWSDIFAMYFETWMALALLSAVRDAVGERFFEPLTEGDRKKISELFLVEMTFTSFSELLDYLQTQKRSVEHIVNNSAITRDVSQLRINFRSGSLVFDLPDLISSCFLELGNPNYLFLIDELENFTDSQQIFINTLIRYRRGRTTFRIGARLYGVKTYRTLGSGEHIRQGAEYQEIRLDDILREHSGAYERFAAELIIQRLKRAKVVPVDFCAADLYGQFEVLDKDDNWSSEFLRVMERYDSQGRVRPHLAKLDKKLLDFGLSQKIADAVIDQLRCVEQPLLEKMNTFLFIRRWRGEASTSIKIASDIGESCQAFRSGGAAGAKDYASTLSHFSSDLIAQMYRECRQRIPYAGFKTFVELSMGIPRNLLGIIGQIYKHARFSGENPFGGKPISVQSQTSGVLDGAKAFWIEAQPDVDAPQVRESIEALALVLRSIRFSDAPPECDLCTIALEFEHLSPSSRSSLSTAANWSHLIRIEAGHRNKNNDSIDIKYQLAPMLAPIWELSHHRRGVIQLSEQLSNAILDNKNRQNLVQLVEERIKNMNAPRRWRREERQETLL